MSKAAFFASSKEIEGNMRQLTVRLMPSVGPMRKLHKYKHYKTFNAKINIVVKMERQHLLLAFGLLSLLPAIAQGCIMPYERIGTQCLFIDSLTHGSFFDMRLHCNIQGEGGKLAHIPDANQHTEIINYIKKNGLDRYNYWVDATDSDVEGTWKWGDGSLVPRGSPFWRYECDGHFTERPNVDSNSNCAILDLESHFRMADTSCLGDIGEVPYSPICEQI
ncbi:uncharacterized protein [Palaemon carinicauda]|uniref:uncharacterized protein n=1 Tax=Palaemon carinicauda TaxID=392227 RepID=UPI0035B69C02